MTAAPMLDRKPPYSEDAEQAVLSAMLMDRDAVTAALRMLPADAFYFERNRRIYRAMAALVEQGSVVDPLTLAEALTQSGELDAAGGKDYLGYLVDVVPTAANIAHHCEIVHEKAARRRIIAESTQAAQAAYDERTPIVDRTATQSPDVLLTERTAAANRLLDRSAAVAGIHWPWLYLDALVGPMMPRDIIVVGGHVGGGKTTVALSALDEWAMQSVGILFFSLERDPEVAATHWAALRLGFPVKHVLRGEWNMLPAGAEQQVRKLVADQKAVPFVQFAPVNKLTVATLTKWCRWAQDRIGARVVVVDHLHRMDTGAGDRRVSTTDMMRTLKDAARELDLIIIATAQLNRSSDPLDHYTRPTLARLKESAAIAEEADVVVMTSRVLRGELPKNYAERLKAGTLSEQDLAEPGAIMLTCRKHRLDDSALNRSVKLYVSMGRVVMP